MIKYEFILYCFSLTCVDYKMPIPYHRQQLRLQWPLLQQRRPAVASVWEWRHSVLTCLQRRRLVLDIRRLIRWLHIRPYKLTLFIYKVGRHILRAGRSVQQAVAHLPAPLERVKKKIVPYMAGVVLKVGGRIIDNKTVVKKVQ